ncbi:MAG: hydrogenase formation protein HypD [Deltaproteobacteria bacterium]|nr:hydrogenase formation protein HypD [Deltaproteobacteria bacterium]
MKYVEEYRDTELGRNLIKRIASVSKRPARFMEFCGGHTVSIMKHGIRQLLPSNIEMLSGPGCPVCVTPVGDIDKAVFLAGKPGAIISTFGDMIRVPGSVSTLQKAKGEGADVRIVYSTQDALEIARQNPAKSVIFVGVGFETTAPTVAASVRQAFKEGLTNYYVLSLHKLTPPIIRALLTAQELDLDGIICPGHVSAVTGARPYEFIGNEYNISAVISGFEPLDILLAVEMLIRQVEEGRHMLENAYPRVVRYEGNRQALDIMNEVFEVSPSNWRGIGVVDQSGLRLRDKYGALDAEKAFDIERVDVRENPGCICGEILRGVKSPSDCRLFKNVCNPGNPVGPCMVSAEGSCSAHYLYGGENER